MHVAGTHNYVTVDGTIHHNSGKSSGCVIELVKRGHVQAPMLDGIRRSRWAVVRNTYLQLQDTTIKTFFEWLPEGVMGVYERSKHNFIVKAFKNVEIEFMFRALDRPEQIANLLSLNLTGAFLNEAREAEWSIVKAIIGRTGRYPQMIHGGATWAGIIMDTNPPEDDSWWYELFEEKVKPGTDEPHDFSVELFKQPSGLSSDAENLPNLPPNYYQDLAAIYDDEATKVYVHGEYGYVQDGKPVFPEYSDSLHLNPDLEADDRAILFRTWDFGLTPACVFAQFLPNGRFIVLDELIADDMGADRFSDELLEHCAIHYDDFDFEDIGDPAGEARSQADERSCFEILQGKGIMIEGGEQSLEIRVSSLKKPLTTLVDGKPQLQIHPRCRKLRKGFQGRYRFKRKQGTRNTYADKPEKNEFSHPMDALQYLATRLFADQIRGQMTKVRDAKEHHHRQRGRHGWMGN